jgi:Family of unknown function (DUF5675)
MDIRVRRDLYSSLSTQGQLLLDLQHFCYTLEPPIKTDGTKPRAIPTGTYPLTIRWSDEFGKHVPHVEDVHDFIAIEQHIGNYPKNTKACTLVGMERGPLPDFIAHSLKAWTALMAKYMEVAVLTNPEAPSEKSHIWKVGYVTYEEAQT